MHFLRATVSSPSLCGGCQSFQSMLRVRSLCCFRKVGLWVNTDQRKCVTNDRILFCSKHKKMWRFEEVQLCQCASLRPTSTVVFELASLFCTYLNKRLRYSCQKWRMQKKQLFLLWWVFKAAACDWSSCWDQGVWQFETRLQRETLETPR